MQARSVLLSWEPGSDGLSPVRYYTVQVRELPSQNWTVHSASVNHESTSYTVDRYGAPPPSSITVSHTVTVLHRHMKYLLSCFQRRR